MAAMSLCACAKVVLDRRDIRPGNLAELELLAQDGERVGLDFHDLLGRRDLTRQGRLLHRAATTIEVKHADQAKPDSGNL
jgi:hypothetical protein